MKAFIVISEILKILLLAVIAVCSFVGAAEIVYLAELFTRMSLGY